MEQSDQKNEAIRQSDYLNSSYESLRDSITSHEKQLQLAIDQRAKLLQEQSPESAMEVEKTDAAIKATEALGEASEKAETTIQQLSQTQIELGNNTQIATEQIKTQNQALQEAKSGVPINQYDSDEIINRAGDVDNVQKYVYTLDQAEAKLKEIKSRHTGGKKKEEARQLNDTEKEEVWKYV